MNQYKQLVGTGLAVAALLLAAGCGDKGSDSGSGSSTSGGSGEIKTGPGVTAKDIKLGILTDLSGVFAALAGPITNSTKLFWDEQNAKGGVCDRKVSLVIKDHGYDPQKAVVQYRDVGPKVAALQQLLGSPITAALLPQLKTDRMLSLLSAWPSSLLSQDFIIEIGAPYPLEMINGLDYLKEQGKIKSGDKLGHIYFEGEYGENGLVGSKYYAEKNGMSVVEQKIQPTDEDMSGAVSALKRAGVKAILLTTGPTQMASAAGIAASQGLNVPILGNNPTYDPALLGTPAAKALIANAYIAGSVSPWTVDADAVKESGAEYVAKYGEKDAKASVQYGTAMAKVMYEILNKACDNKDLSREGLIKASHELSGVDLGGLIAGTLDYTKPGEPSTRAVYLSRPAKVTGGLTPIKGTFESETAKNYDVSAG